MCVRGRERVRGSMHVCQGEGEGDRENACVSRGTGKTTCEYGTGRAFSSSKAFRDRTVCLAFESVRLRGGNHLVLNITLFPA